MSKRTLRVTLNMTFALLLCVLSLMQGVVTEGISAMVRMLRKAIICQLTIPLTMPAPKPVTILFPVLRDHILKMLVLPIRRIILNVFVTPILLKPVTNLIMASALPAMANMLPVNEMMIKPARKTAMGKQRHVLLCKRRTRNVLIIIPIMTNVSAAVI